MKKIYGTGIHEALERLSDGAGFSIDKDGSYESIIWFSETIPKPSKETVENEIDVVLAEYAAKEYQSLRKIEYPPIEDFADAWVKNDEQALEDYRQKCLAVKAKYPKP